MEELSCCVYGHLAQLGWVFPRAFVILSVILRTKESSLFPRFLLEPTCKRETIMP